MALNTDSTDYLTVRRLWSIMSSFKDKIVTALGKKADKSSTVSNVAWSSSKLTKTINGTTTDVVSASTLKSAMSLNNVTNDAQVKRSEMGTASGVATLDANGIINTSQLPSYVDDVLEYSAKSQFPATGETGKIYVDTSTNLTWRWSGTTYVEISPSLALGETSSTAYRGDRGKAAYDHSQLTSGNPHNVTATDVKAVSYDTNSQNLTDTQKSNARTNIGAGTSNLALGTSSTTAAKGDHTHTTSIASDSSSGTVVTLAHNTQYKLTAGGTSVLFKTPTDSNTDTKVTQTKDDSGTTAYPLLMAGATDPNGSATTARYDSGVKLTPSTNTISANISGNATTATTATDYNTSSGTIKTALSSKLNVDGSNATQVGTSAIVKTLGNGSDNIWNGDRFPANGHSSQATNPDDYTLRSTDHLLNFLFRKGTGGFNYADLDTSMKEFGHAYGATIDSDTGCYGWKIGETSHTGGYSSAAFKAIVVVWEWDAPNWDHNGYSGRNFVGVLDITHRITEGTISDSADKKIGTLTCICPMYCENSNGNRGYTVFVKQAAGTHKAEWYIGRNTASANMNSKIQYGRLSIFPIMEFRWKKFMVQQNSSISFNSDKDEYWGNRNVPFFSYTNYSGVGNDSLPVYINSNSEIKPMERSIRLYDNRPNQTYKDPYFSARIDDNTFCNMEAWNNNGTIKCGLYARNGSGTTAGFISYMESNGYLHFGDDQANSWSGRSGNGSSGSQKHYFNGAEICGSSLRNSGTSHYRLYFGKMTPGTDNGAKHFCGLLEVNTIATTSGAVRGTGFVAIVKIDARNYNEFNVNMSILSNNGWNLTGLRPTLVVKEDGDERLFAIGFTNASGTLQAFQYTRFNLTQIGYSLGFTYDRWFSAASSRGSGEYFWPATLGDAENAVSAKELRIPYGSGSIYLQIGVSDTGNYLALGTNMADGVSVSYASNASTAAVGNLLAVANAAGTGVTSYYMRAIEYTSGSTTYIALTKNDGTNNVRVKSAENADAATNASNASNADTVDGFHIAVSGASSGTITFV